MANPKTALGYLRKARAGHRSGIRYQSTLDVSVSVKANQVASMRSAFKTILDNPRNTGGVRSTVTQLSKMSNAQLMDLMANNPELFELVFDEIQSE